MVHDMNRQRLRLRVTFLLAAGLLTGAALFSTVSPAAAGGGGNDKVTICHAAGRDGTDKYVTLTISENAVYKEQGGHFYENGTPRAGHEDDYFGPCKTVVTTTTVPEETTTTTAPDGTTTTTEPDGTTTTVPQVTTTVPGVTTTVPDTDHSTTTVPSTEPTIGQPTVIERPTTVPAPARLVSQPTDDELPATGLSTAQMAMAGAGLVLIGYGAVLSGRKPDEI